MDTDRIAGMDGLPRELIVVGAGVVGLEYASFLAALGTEVTLIDQRPALLDFVDREIMEALAYHLRQMGTMFRLGEKVTRVGIDPQRDRVFAELESGKKVQADALLYAVGRQANGDQLRLEAAGLQPDPRGKIKVNAHYQTERAAHLRGRRHHRLPRARQHFHGAGPPRELATCSARLPNTCPNSFPYGIYTIPEISMVGQTEETLTANKVPYEVGIAKYNELAKSMMLGDESGMLKLLFDRNTRKLLGVHVIGQRATEIIHIGQAVLYYGGSIEYFRDTVFNYPTLAEAYKVAALDGLNKL